MFIFMYLVYFERYTFLDEISRYIHIYTNVYEIQTVYFKDEREKRNVHVEDISQLL